MGIPHFSRTGSRCWPGALQVPPRGLTAVDAHTIHHRRLPREPVTALCVSFTAWPVDRLTRFGVSCKLSTDVHVSGPCPGRSGEP